MPIITIVTAPRLICTSDFTDYVITYTVAGEQEFDANGNLVDVIEEIPAEGFSQGAGMAQPDPCFPDYDSHLVTAWNGVRLSSGISSFRRNRKPILTS